MKKQKGRKEEKSPCRRNLGTAQQAGTSTWLWARWSGVRQVNRAPAAFLASASQIGFAPKVTEVLRAVETKLQYIHQNPILSPHKP